MAPIIHVDHLSKSFSKHTVLQDLSLEVTTGEAYGLVGLNGAGKTTLIRVLLGILRADQGIVRVVDRDPWNHESTLYRRMGIVLENDGFWGNLTFEENIRIFAAAKGVSSDALSSYLAQFWHNTSIVASGKKVKFFSRGQRMQCALCRAFLGWPDVYFLDEPAIALDVDAYAHFTRLVGQARSRGATFLISSHQLDAIDQLCTRVGILRNKTVTGLSCTNKTVAQRNWELDADNTSPFAAIITSLSCGSALFEQGIWHFSVDHPDRTIPLLVKLLVDAGCAIRMIRPVPNDFSAAIRNEYRVGTVSSPSANGEMIQ